MTTSLEPSDFAGLLSQQPKETQEQVGMAAFLYYNKGRKEGMHISFEENNPSFHKQLDLKRIENLTGNSLFLKSSQLLGAIHGKQDVIVFLEGKRVYSPKKTDMGKLIYALTKAGYGFKEQDSNGKYIFGPSSEEVHFSIEEFMQWTTQQIMLATLFQITSGIRKNKSSAP